MHGLISQIETTYSVDFKATRLLMNESGSLLQSKVLLISSAVSATNAAVDYNLLYNRLIIDYNLDLVADALCNN